MPPIQAQQVAAELRRRLPGVGVKKLHKLLYYCQGHHLATFDEPLFIESISASHMDPVGFAIEDAVLDEAVLNTVGYVVSRYGALTGNDLERLTHSEDPWIDANSMTADDEDREIQPDPAELRAWLRETADNQGPGRPDTVDGIRARARSHQ